MNSLTKWHFSPETEAKRLLHAASQIANHFYQIKGFLVLPEIPTKAPKSQIVIFPDLPYQTIHRFWDRAKAIDVSNLPLNVPEKLLKQTTALLNPTNPKYQTLKNNWTKAELQFLSHLQNLIPEAKAVKKIILHPTTIGTICSFSLFDPKKDDTIHAYIRTDTNIYKIAEAILSALTRPQINAFNGTWSESEILVDWLLSHSTLATTLKKHTSAAYTPTISSTRNKQQNGFYQQSNAYLKKLGIAPPQQPLLKLKGNQFHFKDHPLKKLTSKDKKVLQAFLQKQTLTTDDLATLLFKSTDDFSLYAISKYIERLRKKLEFNGLPGSHIQTIRGKGYKLRRAESFS